jgi:hypothetical protein
MKRDGLADGGQQPGAAGGAVSDRWHQRAGFSVFFDTQPDGPGEPRQRTRLYHEETGDETTFPGSEPTDWVKWMLDRLGSAHLPSEPVDVPASLVSVEIIDARLVGDPTPGVHRVELQLRVTGMTELYRALGARVVTVVFGSGPR